MEIGVDMKGGCYSDKKHKEREEQEGRGKSAHGAYRAYAVGEARISTGGNRERRMTRK